MNLSGMIAIAFLVWRGLNFCVIRITGLDT